MLLSVRQVQSLLGVTSGISGIRQFGQSSSHLRCRQGEHPAEGFLMWPEALTRTSDTSNLPQLCLSNPLVFLAPFQPVESGHDLEVSPWAAARTAKGVIPDFFLLWRNSIGLLNPGILTTATWTLTSCLTHLVVSVLVSPHLSPAVLDPLSYFLFPSPDPLSAYVLEAGMTLFCPLFPQ